jgi:hypothetical protein
MHIVYIKKITDKRLLIFYTIFKHIIIYSKYVLNEIKFLNSYKICF